MNNEEKKGFIIDVHRQYMNFRPYDGATSIDEMRKREDEFWRMYSLSFYKYLPKSLFKYRKPTERAIKNFENDEVWFSFPTHFDDTVDSAINNDIDNELKEIEEHPEIVISKLSKAFIISYAKSKNIQIDEKLIEESTSLFDKNGTFNEIEAKKFLQGKMPGCEVDECITRLRLNCNEVVSKTVLDSVKGFLEYYLDLNKRLSAEVLAFSLAEESDNQAMWGLYADGSRGFCIEYSFPPDSFFGQRMLLNLFPIYYGNKPSINFFDVLINGINSNNNVNGIAYDDYKEWFLSTYTKNPTYSFQKEWRITFNRTMGSNLQKFPFAKSIILGERMSEENKTKLLEIARKKNIHVFQRKMNKTRSKIIVEQII